MATDLERELKRQVSLGNRVAMARVVEEGDDRHELLIWASGETKGDLGSPRLNQRAALYAEQQFERGHTGLAVKRFKDAGGMVEIQYDFPTD